MPATVTLLAPCWKPVMNLMALVNVRKAFIALPASETFLTLTKAIKFITCSDKEPTGSQASQPVPLGRPQ